jgi:hypothetical protein
MRRIAIVLSAAALVAGCGSSGTSANTVATAYFHDLGDGDYDAACTLLTAELRHRLGDCAAALRRGLRDLPVGEFGELRGVSVRHLVYKGDAATLHPADVRLSKTVKDKTGKSKTTTIRSIGANHATNGHGLTLVKVGSGWKISDGGL